MKADQKHCQWCKPSSLHDRDGQPVICEECLRREAHVEPAPLLPLIDPKRGVS